jgi:hypothetical protein
VSGDLHSTIAPNIFDLSEKLSQTIQTTYDYVPAKKDDIFSPLLHPTVPLLNIEHPSYSRQEERGSLDCVRAQE